MEDATYIIYMIKNAKIEARFSGGTLQYAYIYKKDIRGFFKKKKNKKMRASYNYGTTYIVTHI